MRNKSLCFLLLLCCLVSIACNKSAMRQQIAQATTGGNAQRGAAAISRYGCGSCHMIPGISGATGRAAPPLSGIASRIYLAGVLQNTPENMVRWIQHPKSVDEKTLMPDLGVTPRDAADIAGYLYTLK